MAHWNSGDRDGTERLTGHVIPLLAIACVGLTLLYIVVILLGMTGRYYVIEWLAAMALLVFCARAVLADYTLLVRKVLFFLFAFGLPLGLILAGVITRNANLTVHAFVLLGLCALGWTLLESVVSQSTGHTDTMNKQRRQREDSDDPNRPYEVRGLAFSGDALVVLIIAGTACFSVGEYLRLSQGHAILSAMPFALVFYILVGALTSLSKLVQRVQETPGSVRLESGFARTWAGAMLAVLLICGLIAYLLPKTPVIGSGTWVVDRARQIDTPETPGFTPTQVNVPDGQAPVGGQGTHGPGAVGKAPNNGKTTTAPTDRAVEMMTKIATAFEGDGNSPGNGDKQGENGQADGQQQGKGGQGGQDGGKASGSGHGEQDQQAGAQRGTQPPANQVEQLQQTLHNRPDRLAKLLLAVLLGVLALAALVILLVVLIRRHVWYLFANLVRQVWEWLAGKVRRRLAPFFARLAANRREARIRQYMEAIHPFDDPFAEDRPSAESVRAVYTAFQAYLWLLGYERKESETDFMFATRLCDNTTLNEKAVWSITMACVRSEFSPTPLNDPELAELRAAYTQLVTDITTRLPEDVRTDRMHAYRHLLAERQWEREQEADTTSKPSVPIGD